VGVEAAAVVKLGADSSVAAEVSFPTGIFTQGGDAAAAVPAAATPNLRCTLGTIVVSSTTKEAAV